MTQRRALMTAAALGLLAVAAGAFGAHGLAARVEPAALGWWKTASAYQLAHAVVLTGLAVGDAYRSPMVRRAFVFFIVGVLVFSGTLYAMTLGGPRWLGMVTPLGGLSLIAGWASLFVEGLRRTDAAA
jgi:uncharacterized membrane protein YgdD (TMEM256/DUF423 family)